jgi:hypothetical protein
MAVRFRLAAAFRHAVKMPTPTAWQAEARVAMGP